MAYRLWMTWFGLIVWGVGTGGGSEMLSKAKSEDQLTQTHQISVETTEPDGVYQYCIY